METTEDILEGVRLNYKGDPKKNWRIVCAAIRNSRTGEPIAGVRHYDSVMRATIKLITKGVRDTDWIVSNKDNGFFDNYGTFLTRDQAKLVALAAKQITEDHHGMLFSEDLW